jgi:hypothetical protein
MKLTSLMQDKKGLKTLMDIGPKTDQKLFSAALKNVAAEAEKETTVKPDVSLNLKKEIFSAATSGAEIKDVSKNITSILTPLKENRKKEDEKNENKKTDVKTASLVIPPPSLNVSVPENGKQVNSISAKSHDVITNNQNMKTQIQNAVIKPEIFHAETALKEKNQTVKNTSAKEADFITEIKATTVSISKNSSEFSGNKKNDDTKADEKKAVSTQNIEPIVIGNTKKTAFEKTVSVHDTISSDTDRIIKYISKAVKPMLETSPEHGKEYTVVIKLSPPALGNMEIKTVYKEGGDMNVTISASNPDTAAALDTKINVIKSELNSIMTNQSTGINVNISSNDNGTGHGLYNQQTEQAVYVPFDRDNSPLIPAKSAYHQAEKNSYMV